MLRLASLLSLALLLAGCDSGYSTGATTTTQETSVNTELSAPCEKAHGAFVTGLSNAAAKRALLRTLSACKTPAEWTQGAFFHSLGRTGAARRSLTDAIEAFTGRPIEPVLRSYSLQKDSSPYSADLDPAIGPKLLALMCTQPGARGGAACPP